METFKVRASGIPDGGHPGQCGLMQGMSRNLQLPVRPRVQNRTPFSGLGRTNAQGIPSELGNGNFICPARNS